MSSSSTGARRLRTPTAKRRRAGSCFQGLDFLFGRQSAKTIGTFGCTEISLERARHGRARARVYGVNRVCDAAHMMMVMVPGSTTFISNPARLVDGKKVRWRSCLAAISPREGVAVIIHGCFGFQPIFHGFFGVAKVSPRHTAPPRPRPPPPRRPRVDRVREGGAHEDRHTPHGFGASGETRWRGFFGR